MSRRLRLIVLGVAAAVVVAVVAGFAVLKLTVATRRRRRLWRARPRQGPGRPDG
jgi:hypothetical protein